MKKPKDIVILVMGPTGSGKSTFINALRPKELMIVGHTLNSCTQELCVAEIDHSSRHPHLQGHKLFMVDTPGFDDTDVHDAEILGRISQWLKEARQRKDIVGGVIYLHDISLDRYSAAAKRNLELFRVMCGDAALPKVVLGTTKWGRVLPEINHRHEKELKDKHWKELIKKGSTMRRFKNDERSGWEFLEVLLNLEDLKANATIPLDIQEQMADEKLPLQETRAGKNMENRKKVEKDNQEKIRSSFGKRVLKFFGLT